MKYLFFVLLCGSGAFATPIFLNELPLDPPLETRADLNSLGLESALDEFVPLSILERFGVVLQTSSLDGAIQMQTEEIFVEESIIKTRLDWQPEKGWVSKGVVLEKWAAPIIQDGMVFVPIKCLSQLGFLVTATGTGLQIRSEGNTLPGAGLNQILEIRATKGRSSRVTLTLARNAEFFVLEKTTGTFKIKLVNTVTQPRFQAVGSESLSRIRVTRVGNDSFLEAELPSNAKLEVSANGKEVFLDSSDLAVPIPLSAAVPNGIIFETVPVGLSKLHLIRLDPALYRPEVVTAPWGGAQRLLELSQGAVAGVNGGYFDPASMQAVDLLFNGSLQAYSRGNRATIGFLPTTTLFGIPRARMVLTLGGNDFNINQIRPVPHPQNLTFFMGDGFVPVGGLGFTSYIIANGKIIQRLETAFTPKKGQFTVSFNPKTNPNLERNAGDSALIQLTWNDPAWQNIDSALAAGPRLIANGEFAVNPLAEGFDPNSDLWRPTRQVGFGIDNQNKYVIAMLEFGSPEDFAKVLMSQGLQNAVRLDSGTSAQMVLAGGAVAGRIGRTIPNALVFKPRE